MEESAPSRPSSPTHPAHERHGPAAPPPPRPACPSCPAQAPISAQSKSRVFLEFTIVWTHSRPCDSLHSHGSPLTLCSVSPLHARSRPPSYCSPPPSMQRK